MCTVISVKRVPRYLYLAREQLSHPITYIGLLLSVEAKIQRSGGNRRRIN